MVKSRNAGGVRVAEQPARFRVGRTAQFSPVLEIKLGLLADVFDLAEFNLERNCYDLAESASLAAFQSFLFNR